MRARTLRERGQANLLRVAVVFGSGLFLLWLYAIVGPAVIEPLYNFAVDQPGASGQTELLKRYRAVVLEYAPALFLLGLIALVFIYAVFRERFSGPARRPP